MNNPFLTNTVYDARIQARVSYLETLTRMQKKRGSTPRDLLEASKRRHGANLDLYWEQAVQAADSGDTRSASSQLAYIVMEWGHYKAYQDLIDANGKRLDPASPATVNDFDQEVSSRVVFWTTEFLNILRKGERQRKSDQETIYMDRTEHLFGTAHQVIQDQGRALDQAHQHNKQYADTTLEALKQAQQATEVVAQNTKDLYAEIQASMRENLKAQQATTETLVQNQPIAREQAQVRAQFRGCLTRGLIIVILMFACPVAFTLAYLILRVVVLRQ
jgi:hypothetical protein